MIDKLIEMTRFLGLEAHYFHYQSRSLLFRRAGHFEIMHDLRWQLVPEPPLYLLELAYGSLSRLCQKELEKRTRNSLIPLETLYNFYKLEFLQ